LFYILSRDQYKIWSHVGEEIKRERNLIIITWLNSKSGVTESSLQNTENIFPISSRDYFARDIWWDHVTVVLVLILAFFFGVDFWGFVQDEKKTDHVMSADFIRPRLTTVQINEIMQSSTFHAKLLN